MNLRHKEALLQHQELMIITDRISLIISAPQGVISEARLRKLLEYEIDFLTETLREHFLFEENGGYLSITFADTPDLSRRAQILRNEHVEMAAGLDTLKKQLSGLPVSRIAASLQGLIQTLHQHERAENELLELLLCEEHDRKPV